MHKLIVFQWKLKTFSAAILAVTAYLLGDIAEEILAVILILLLLDWITGIWKATILKSLWSRASVKGAVKIIIYLILLVVACQIKKLHPAFNLIDSVALAYIGITEGLSILENLFVICAAYDIKIPILNLLMDKLYVARKNGGD